jgi:ribosomal protein S18 acetylase RimI-like enzyme
MIEASVGAALADPGLARYWLLERCGAPIGAIAVTREWSDWCNASYWYIQFVFVEPAHRGGGGLRALVDEVRAEAARDGAPEVRLYVHRENARAIRAYEKLGFAQLPYMMMALR